MYINPKDVQGLSQLIQAFGQINDPDKKKRDEVNQRLLSDPNFAQQFKNLSPEEQQQLVGSSPKWFHQGPDKEVINAINKTPLSLDALKENYQKQAVNNYMNTTGMQAAANSGIGGMLAPPTQTTQQQDYAKSILGMQTSKQEELQAAQLKHAQNENTLGTEQVRQILDKRDNTLKVQKYMTDNKVDPITMYNDDKTPTDVKNALLSSDLAEPFKQQYNIWHNNQQLSLEKQRLALSKDQFQASLENSNKLAAKSMWLQLGSSDITPKDIENYFKNPSGEKADLVKAAIDNGPVKVRQQNQMEYNRRFNELNIFASKNPDKKTEIENLITNLNALGNLTGKPDVELKEDPNSKYHNFIANHSLGIMSTREVPVISGQEKSISPTQASKENKEDPQIAKMVTDAQQMIDNGSVDLKTLQADPTLPTKVKARLMPKKR